MTPQEHLDKFSDELELLLNKYRVIPIVVAETVTNQELGDGSLFNGTRYKVEYAALPETKAPTDKTT